MVEKITYWDLTNIFLYGIINIIQSKGDYCGNKINGAR